jgi:NADH-quinone oxidoreductase subunit C
MHKDLVRLINEHVSGAGAELVVPEDTKMDSSIVVKAEKIFAVCEYLKTNAQYPFNVLQVISGVDYTEYLEVCYMLAHFHEDRPYEVILKTRLTDRVNPTLETIVPLYPAANFQERECYDMLGVHFKNHPDHRRILCPDDWKGFPLRKDYIAQKVYRDMEVYPEGKMNMADREFIVRQDMIKKAQGDASSEPTVH